MACSTSTWSTRRRSLRPATAGAREASCGATAATARSSMSRTRQAWAIRGGAWVPSPPTSTTTAGTISYVTCFGPNRLYRNNGDGTFSDVTAKAGVGDPRWSTGAAFADYDGDGWLDLFVANYVDVRLEALPEFGKGKFCEFHGIPVQCGPRGLRGSGDSLYRNKRRWHVRGRVRARPVWRIPTGASAWASRGATSTGTGTPISSSPTMPARTFCTGTTATARSSTWRCRPGPRSARTARSRAPWASPSATTTTQAAGASSSRISRTNTTPSTGTTRAFQFTDVSFSSQTAKASIPLVGWGTHFLDYDNDGWLDLLVVNGHVYPQVERAGHADAVRAAQAAVPQQPRRHVHGSHVVSRSRAQRAVGQPRLGRGRSRQRRRSRRRRSTTWMARRRCSATTAATAAAFLVVDLEGRAGNRSAVGAIVTVRPRISSSAQSGAVATAICRTAIPRLHFGLGTRTKVDSMEVRWPNGTVQRFGEIPANTFIKIVEGAPAPQTIRHERSR